MMHKPTIYAVALSTVCLLPFAAMAQDGGFDISAAPAQPQATSSANATQSAEISLGMQWVGGTNTNLYGRYNGSTLQGLDVLGSFSVNHRDKWDSGDTFYYDISGINLDFQTGDRLAKGFYDGTYVNGTNNKLGPEAELSLAIGNQGTWGLTADYDAISYTGNVIASLYTVNGNIATPNDFLQAWGGASNDPLTMGTTTGFDTTTITPHMHLRQVGTRRDILKFGGHYVIGDWIISANVRHEHKQGSLEESLRMTYSGAAFTLPVDYDTDNFTLSAAYYQPHFQAIVEYTYSKFTDANLGVVIPDIVTQTSLASGPYAQSAFYSTPPSNSAHYVTIMMGDDLFPGTRVNFNGRFGVEVQDNTFPPNSADPNLSSTLGNPTYTWFSNLNSMNQGTSAFSPDASAWIYQANIAIDSSLAKHLDGRLAYSVDGRHVSINQFMVWTGGHSLDGGASTPNYVVPQNWVKQKVDVSLAYTILPESNTKISVGYTYRNTHRTNAQVEHSDTSKETVRLSSMLGREGMASVTYEHLERTGELIYGTAWGNLETGVPEIDGTPSGAYYQAPKTSNTVTFRADYVPSEDLSGGLFLRYEDEHFHYPSIPSTSPDWTLVGHGEGVWQDSNLTVGPNITYRPNKDVNLNVYYTYEWIFFDFRGNGQCYNSNTGNCLGSVGYFQNKYDSSTNTAGVSADWQATSKLKLGVDYNYQSGTILFTEFNGVQVPVVTQEYQNVVNYPDINSRLHQLKLTAIYQLTPSIEWSVMYAYNMFHNNDWDFLTPPAQPSVDGGTSISILTPGYPPPNYDVSTIGTMFKVSL